MRRMRLSWLLVGLLLASPASAAMSGRLGGQYRYWNVSDGNDLRDVLVYWAARSWHVQLEHWNFVNHDTDDQFRPEVGLHLHDRRNGVYTIQWRHERHQERYWLGTDQVFTSHLVGRVMVSPIVAEIGRAHV